MRNWVESPDTINSLVWCSACKLPNLWWSCWCMLACVGCWSCCDLGPVKSAVSMVWSEFWAEGSEMEILLGRDMFATRTVCPPPFFGPYWGPRNLNGIRPRSLGEGVKQVCTVRAKICQFLSPPTPTSKLAPINRCCKTGRSKIWGQYKIWPYQLVLAEKGGCGNRLSLRCHR
jgi:hypothetical protein